MLDICFGRKKSSCGGRGMAANKWDTWFNRSNVLLRFTRISSKFGEVLFFNFVSCGM